MPYLVDGDNLLGTWPGRRRSDGERQRLAFELDRVARRIGRRIVVVFDGVAPPGMNLGPDVQFAGARHSADQVILDRMQAAEDPRGWIVVTSDRSLGDQCRWRGARVERSDRFRAKLRSGVAREKPEHEDDLDHWLDVFGGRETD